MTNRWAMASLLVMAILWGSTFFVLKDMLTRIEASDLLAVRFALAGLVMLVLLNRRLHPDRRLARHGLVLGVLYSSAQLLQTYGLAHTSVSVSGFLTGLYVVATPVFEAVLLRVRAPRRIWFAVALATAGLAVLTIMPGAGTVGFGWGEALTVAGAFAYAGHIIYAGRVSSPENALRLSALQTVVIAVVCVLAALPGGIELPRTGSDWLAMVYLSVICGALTLFLQVWAQARVEPTRAAIIMSSEPIWAATFAILVGQEMLGWRTVLGGAALVSAMIIASVPAPGPSSPEPRTLTRPRMARTPRTHR